jgi:hypothetical protein
MTLGLARGGLRRDLRKQSPGIGHPDGQRDDHLPDPVSARLIP